MKVSERWLKEQVKAKYNPNGNPKDIGIYLGKYVVYPAFDPKYARFKDKTNIVNVWLYYDGKHFKMYEEDERSGRQYGESNENNTFTLKRYGTLVEFNFWDFAKELVHRHRIVLRGYNTYYPEDVIYECQRCKTEFLITLKKFKKCENYYKCPNCGYHGRVKWWMIKYRPEGCLGAMAYMMERTLDKQE